MADKEYLINKWKFMIEGLDSKKTSQARFAKIFETTSLHNDTKNLKLILPTLQKLLYSIPKVKSSSSHKNELHIADIERDMIIDNGTIMVDAAAAFIQHAVNVTKSKFEEEEFKINYLRMVNARNKISISILY